MTLRLLAASLAAIGLIALGASQRKEPEPPAKAKAAAVDTTKKAADPSAPAQPAAARGSGQALQPNPERNAYFGETHLHTSWSVDAWVMGNRLAGRKYNVMTQRGSR